MRKGAYVLQQLSVLLMIKFLFLMMPPVNITDRVFVVVIAYVSEDDNNDRIIITHTHTLPGTMQFVMKHRQG